MNGTPLDFRPDDPAYLADPFPLFRRMQGEIALPAVLARFRRIEPAGEPGWINSMVFRGMSRMPVRVSR